MPFDQSLQRLPQLVYKHSLRHLPHVSITSPHTCLCFCVCSFVHRGAADAQRAEALKARAASFIGKLFKSPQSNSSSGTTAASATTATSTTSTYTSTVNSAHTAQQQQASSQFTAARSSVPEMSAGGVSLMCLSLPGQSSGLRSGKLPTAAAFVSHRSSTSSSSTSSSSTSSSSSSSSLDGCSIIELEGASSPMLLVPL
jgi:hypothetical protein